MDQLEFKQHIEENFLSCKICEEEVKANETELKLLPCQHSLCGKCLNEMIKKKRKVTCPFCREEHPLPKSGEFPVFRCTEELSELISKLVDGYQEGSHESKAVTYNPTKSRTKPVSIQKFKFILPQQVNMCWGKSGKLNTTNYGDNPLKPQGLYCIDVLSGRVERFGELDSTYAGVLYTEGKLFAFNSSRRSIEIYLDEEFIRREHRCFSSFTQLMWITKHPLGGTLLLFKTKENRLKLMHTDSDCNTVEVQRHDKSTKKCADMVAKHGVTLVCRGSIWLVNKIDCHLYEIPAEQTTEIVSYKEPIRHCRLPNEITVVGECGKCSIAYKLSRSDAVRKLDVSMLGEQSKPHQSLNKGQKTIQKGQQPESREVKRCSTILLNNVEGNNVKVAASEDGFYAVLADDSILSIYSTDDAIIESMIDEDVHTKDLHLTTYMYMPDNQFMFPIFQNFYDIFNFLFLFVAISNWVQPYLDQWKVFLIAAIKIFNREVCEDCQPYGWPATLCNWLISIEIMAVNIVYTLVFSLIGICIYYFMGQ